MFVYAASLDDIDDGEVLGVEVDSVEIALIRHGDTVWAIHDECTHAAIPLSEGDVDGCEIECWAHGSRFNIQTGACLNPPAIDPVQTYRVKIDGQAVLVDVTAHGAT